jgi:hypothetical protein
MTHDPTFTRPKSDPTFEQVHFEYSESSKSSNGWVGGCFLLLSWFFLSRLPLLLLPRAIGDFRVGEVEIENETRASEEDSRSEQSI